MYGFNLPLWLLFSASFRATVFVVDLREACDLLVFVNTHFNLVVLICLSAMVW